MASVEFQNVTKTFGAFTAAKDLDLEIGDGEFVCLLGPSGCGKTTSLRMIAGLEITDLAADPDRRRDVTDLHPKDRQIAMVFQDYALYPHMKIADNIAYPLKVRGEPRGKRHARAPGGRRRPEDRRPPRPAAEPDLRRPAAAHLARPGAGLPEPTSTSSTSRSPTSTPSCGSRRAGSSTTCSATWA